MSNEKLIISKLLKIAESQQKVIQKIAQAVDPNAQGGASLGWEDLSEAVKPVVLETAKALKAKGVYGVQSADYGAQTGKLVVKLTHPATASTQEYYAVKDRVRDLLTGKNVGGKQIKSVDVIGVTA